MFLIFKKQIYFLESNTSFNQDTNRDTPTSGDLKEAEHYIVEDGELNCSLCPHNCRITEGNTGICKVRKNIDNKLYTLNYGNPVTISIDPIEKKPLFHFHPSSKTLSIGFAGCNLCCLNCQNHEISQIAPTNETYNKITPQDIVELAIKNNCPSISYTYTEPLISFEFVKECCILAKKSSIKNIVVSAGYVNAKPLKEIIPYIDAFNIDLKSFNSGIYLKLTGAKIKYILNTLMIIRNSKSWLELTNLVIPEYSDNISEIKEMCTWLAQNGFSKTPLHFSRFFPTHKLSDLRFTSYETLSKARDIAKGCGIKHVYLGNVKGTNDENTICTNCSSTVITRSGFSIIKNSAKYGVCSECGEKIDGFVTPIAKAS